MNALGKRLHLQFLVYAHWFMSIRISQMRDHSISVDQDRYATYVVSKYLDTVTVNTNIKFYKTTFPSGMIFTKAYVYTSDEQVESMTR